MRAFFFWYSKGVSKVFVVNKYCVWWSQWSPVVLGSSVPNGCKNRLNRTEHRNIRRFTMLMSSGTNGMVPMGCQQWTRLLFLSQYISGWWFGTFFIFHNIWDNPSHWLIFLKILKLYRYTITVLYNSQYSQLCLGFDTLLPIWSIWCMASSLCPFLQMFHTLMFDVQVDAEKEMSQMSTFRVVLSSGNLVPTVSTVSSERLVGWWRLFASFPSFFVFEGGG